MSDLLALPRFARLDEYFGSPWLVEPLAAQQLWEAAGRLDLKAHMEGDPPEPLAVEMVPAPNGRTVAVIPISGIMMKGRSSIGGTSTIDVRRAIRNAVHDPGVSGILLNIDSPGGTVAGVEELAAEVRRAGARKPVWAQAEDLLASAAYWVASQARKVFANAQTALIGSVGTFITIYDVSGAASAQGVRVLHFATGPLKGAGVAGTQITPEQSAYFQSVVDGTQVEFDRAVTGGRGFTAEQLKAVRSGGVWKAAEAKALGLIDGIQPAARTIEQLSRAAEPAKDRRAGTLPTLGSSVLPTLKGAT
jgi:signal peptide peptidase SppA